MKKNQLSKWLHAALLLALCCFATNQAFAQKPKDEKKKNKTGVGVNMDKVELLFSDVTVTNTSSSGRSYSYNTAIPQVRINGGAEKDYDGKEMLTVFKNCPEAKKEVNLYLENHRKAPRYFWGGFLIGGGIGMTGVLAAGVLDQKGKKGSLAAFATCFGVGLTTMAIGVVKARKYRKNADIHMRSSVEKYNRVCYKPPVDTMKTATGDPTAASPGKKPSSNKSVDGVTEHYKEDVSYKMIRNEPAALKFWSVGVSPLYMQLANNRGVNLFLGADATFQFGSKLGLSAFYKRAYVDNLSEDSDRNSYNGSSGKEFPAVGYKKATQNGLTASFEIWGKDREVEHSIFLGNKKMGGVQVENRGLLKAKERLSYTLRGGISNENAIYYNVNTLPIGTSDTTLTYPLDGFGNIPVPVEEIGNAMPMVKSACLTVGFARKKISDLKVELLNSSSFKGKRKSVGFSEFYADFMYGFSLKSGKVTYQYQPSFSSLETANTAPLRTDRTRFSKVGWRVGFNSIYFNGVCIGMEGGVRPGIDTNRGYIDLIGLYRFGGRMGD